MDELIAKSQHILIAELISSETSDRRTIHHFIVKENLKGSWEGNLVFQSFSKLHSENNFENHNAPEFWENDTDRSDWPCCICGPDHTFKKGVKYLLFPDAFGARKSAEIIIDKSIDKWYSYVVNNMKK